ncbi:MAG: methyltransferase domain-containing protein [Lysobacteraceae bacterium]|nr:MAG: methyltransferase domain-containing protein [Xanthomonadaceae bacterium]
MGRAGLAGGAAVARGLTAQAARPTRPFDRAAARAIAHAFAPPRPFGNRWDYHYARIKLSTDPLYPGVLAALRGARAPLLDLGCGLGLLAHALRGDDQRMAYLGVDNDAGKIVRARRAADNAALTDLAFETVDLAAGLPAHRGSVAILDVLQFVAPQAQDDILDGAIAMLEPGARLVIRTCFDDGGKRARITRHMDALSRWLGWMNAGPKRYPDPDALRARFEAAELRCAFAPLYGSTPFNNWLVVAER